MEVTNVHGLSERLNIGVKEYANSGSLKEFPIQGAVKEEKPEATIILRSRTIRNRRLLRERENCLQFHRSWLIFPD